MSSPIIHHHIASTQLSRDLDRDRNAETIRRLTQPHRQLPCLPFVSPDPRAANA